MPYQTLKRKTADWLMSVALFPAALMLKRYRDVGTQRLPLTTERLRRIGVFPIRNQYYEPLFDPSQLSEPLDRPRSLPGIDLNVQGQLAFLQHLDRRAELLELGWNAPKEGADDFRFGNGTFESGDADFLYQFLRFTKPRKVIEIGSGNSTKVARTALARNEAETGQPGQHLCVEPYEMPWLERLDGIQVVRRRVQDAQIDWSRELQAGDLLFIDSSHIIRPQGDVLMEYLQILPQLQPGVYVHVHDIFTPRDYLRTWVVDQVLFWNEQYLLEALLTNSSRYEVLAALNFLGHDHHDALQEVCPYLTAGREPGSFYLRVR